MRRELCKRQGRERPPAGELIGVRRDVGGEMAKPRKFPELPYGSSAPAKGGASALKVVLVGALVAFGGYSAIAGASMLLGPSSQSAGSAVASKPDFDCASSRFAWRPECQAEKAHTSATPEEVRRTRRRSGSEPAAPPSGSPVAVAAVAPGAPATPAEPFATPASAAAETPAVLGELAQSAAERATTPDRNPVARREPNAAERPARERTARSRTERQADELEETGSIRPARPKAKARPRTRSPLALAARRNAQFASLRGGSRERDRAAGGWRARREARASAPRRAARVLRRPGRQDRTHLRTSRRATDCRPRQTAGPDAWLPRPAKGRPAAAGGRIPGVGRLALRALISGKQPRLERRSREKGPSHSEADRTHESARLQLAVHQLRP